MEQKINYQKFKNKEDWYLETINIKLKKIWLKSMCKRIYRNKIDNKYVYS